MAQKNVTIAGAAYSNVPAVELPITGGGGTKASFFEISDTTAVASDVASGKYFFTASGQLTLGTNQGGSGDGYVWQDAQGYVHLSDEEGTQPIYDTLNVNASGTFTPAQGHAYNSVIVPSGTASTPATTVTATPSISISNSGLITATASATKSVTPSVSAGWVASGTSGTITVSGSNTSQLTTQAAKTVTPTEAEQTAVASGRYTTGVVKVGAISSSYVGSGITRRTSTDLTVSGATVTAPSGYYASSASKSVASGTAGTPTATKGTVSNHAVSVTPSVTNTAGYISGGTISGTAVSVSASELVSGNLAITENGTGIDVTNYATVSVNVSGGASNVVTGTFTTGSTRASNTGRVTVPYSGNGYPIMISVFADYGTGTGQPGWLASMSNYDVGHFVAYKRVNTAPTYTAGTDSANLAFASFCYRYNSSSTSVSGAHNGVTYVGASYVPAASAQCVKFIGDGTTIGYYIGNGTSATHGLSPDTTYTYLVLYSE